MSSPWHWSDSLGQRYRLIEENGKRYYLLENGNRMPREQPQSPIDPRSPQAPQRNVSNYPNTAQNYNQPGPGRYTYQSQPQPSSYQSQPQPSSSQSQSSSYQSPQATYQSQPSSNLPLAQLQALTLNSNVANVNNTARQTFPSGSREYPNAVETRDANGIRARFATGPSGERVLLGTDGDQELLDPRFKKRPSAFFTVGKVFKTLWTEPSPGASTGTHVTPVLFRETVYTQIRRFVVVRPGNQYCIAVQITTYGGRGLAKPTVTASEHALIYTGQRPQTSEFDRGMIPIDIAVDPSEGELLDPQSRLNLGKLYTIEHKVKAKPMGMVRNVNDLLRAWEVATPAIASSSTSATRSATSGRTNQPTPSASQGYSQGYSQGSNTQYRVRRESQGSAGSGGSGGDPEVQAQRLRIARAEGRISAEEYQTGMRSAAARRADQIRQERMQRPIEEEDDDGEEDDDDDEDGEDEDEYERR